MKSKYRVKRHAVEQPIDPSYRLIALSGGHNAVVDAYDYEWLNQWNWYTMTPDGIPYAFRHARIDSIRTTVLMHRLILGCTIREEEGDHRNHDTLDNRRSNLRKCTSAENKWNIRISSQNKSGFKGVSFDRTRGKWAAKISFHNKTVNIGRFDVIEEAVAAYDAKARELFGEFAHTNQNNLSTADLML